MSSLEDLAKAILDNRVAIKPWGSTGEYVVTVDPAPAPASALDTDLETLRTMTPVGKLAIIEAMGFTRVGSDHQPDCPHAINAGYLCNCVAPADTFSMPIDVLAFLKQDYESRMADKRDRTIPEVERF